MGRAAVLGAALFACACALVAHAAGAPTSPADRQLIVGLDDDTAKWRTRPDRLLSTYRHLGIDAVRLTIPWQRGQNRPTWEVGVYLHRAAAMVARGQRVVLAVYGRPGQAPLDDIQRRHYAQFLHHVLGRIPKIRDVVVWNEVNSPDFWPVARGPRAYEALLAECWDRLRGLRPYVNLISSTAARHDPAGFMRAVGAAYRESGRKRPIITTFGHNPYPLNAAEPPWVRHDDPASVSQADLPRYLEALREAFHGTGQRLPSAQRPAVWYMENGFQTTVSPSKSQHYHGEETDHWAVPPVAPAGVDPWYRDQASQLRDALLLAHCQPEVGAFFNFELIDEDRLAGWQSGVMWRDGTRKPSYEAFRKAIAHVQARDIDCSRVPGAGGPIPEAPPDAAAGPARLDVVQNARVTTNYERAFAERPDVYAAWGELSGAIKANMDLRRYELATLAAARRLRSSYCSLAHGRVLLEQFGEPVEEIARDFRAAGLDEVDVAVMDLAELVVDDAASINEADLQRLRDLGLSDAETMDVVLAAAARCFFAKAMDALGVLPDAEYQELAPELREVLVVGRPIADT